MRFHNITFFTYAQLEDKTQFDFVIKFSKEFELKNDYFKIGDITELTFGQVKEIQHKYEKGLEYSGYIDFLKDVKNLKVEEIVNTRLLDFYQSLNYLNSEIERLNIIEAKTLSHEPSSLEIRAGIDKFNVFGNFNQIAFFCEKFNWSLEYVKGLKYSDAFAFLYRDKVSNDFQKNYTKLSASK